MKAYVCIGGPLDGQFATSKDFQREHITTDYNALRTQSGLISHYTNPQPVPTIHHPAGKFVDHKDKYTGYNSGYRGYPSMIWVYKPLLKSPVNAGR